MNQIKRTLPRSLCTMCCLLSLAMGCALAGAPKELAATLDKRLAERALVGARIGVYVQSLRDGDIWFARQEYTPLVPASNAKILIAAMALDYLTPDYSFHTQLRTDGRIVNGVLEGNLYLRGTGDPSLTAAHLRALAHILSAGNPARGIPPITAIHGQLVLDDTCFPGPRRGDWERDDLPWGYAAPAGALSCERNAVTVTVRGMADGQPPQVTVTPDVGLYTVSNQAVSRRQARAGALRVIPARGQVRIAGHIAPGDEVTERLSVPDPTRFTALIFHQALRAVGLDIAEAPASASANRPQSVLVEHLSPPVKTLLTTMLKESDNHYAEQIRWTLLARQAAGAPHAPVLGYPALLHDYTRDAGMLWYGISLEDGCGLSRRDALSPFAVARCLIHLVATPQAGIFADALPIAGVDGTLRERLRNTPAAGNAHAKTGSMHGVSALSGYVNTAAGEPLVFSILVNDCHTTAIARRLQDDLVSTLASQR